MTSKRKTPEVPTLAFQDKSEPLQVELRIITPMFGGGVHIDPQNSHHKVCDARTPVRGAALRGHLRFWWRATIGCTLATHQAMLARETEIWGNASSPGAVSLWVSRQPERGKEVVVYDTKPGNNGNYQARAVDSAIAYGAFSLQPQSEHLRSNDAKVREGGKLQELAGPVELQLRFPGALRDDVVQAVNAWKAFGGLGGRTRRGFGAVGGGDLSVESLKALVKPARRTLDKVPCLHGARLEVLSTSQSGAIDALKQGLGKLQKMRQGPGLGRKPGRDNPSRPGRSRWPEPELIRVLTRTTDPAHRERFVDVDKMPRWRFGMPIVFHFQSRTDPTDVHLVPVDHERMASPLIIRPFKQPDGKYRCLALVLNVPGLEVPLKLDRAPQSPEVRGDLTLAEVNRITPLAGSPDALTAFLKAFKS